MKNSKYLYVWVIQILLILGLNTLGLTQSLEETDEKRNKLIGYMLSKQLPSLHFSDKAVDNELSQAAFDLYLRQLDFQKRFLLQNDVEQLNAYAELIDDNLSRGTIILPKSGYDILGARISQAERIVKELLLEPIDPKFYETMENDPEKLAYAPDEEALRERWRMIIKAQVINRYLDLEEEQIQEGKIEQAAGSSEYQEDLWEEALKRVEKRFTEFFDRLDQETLQDHYDRYFNAVARAFDPHTNYMAPSRKEDFDIQMRGSLEGIGALLREEDGFIKVVRIIPGSASARQGRLEAEDIILAVGESDDEPVEVTDMRLRDAVRLIRGPKGTEVRLTVRKPDGRKEIIPIVRDVVQIEEAFVKQAVLEAGGKQFGYILVPSFYRDFEKTRNGGQGRNSTDDTRTAIVDLQAKGVEGIILDLRNNGGGSLVDAVDIAGLFIEQGPVVQVKNSYGMKRVLEDTDYSTVYDGPLVVLVNQFSASASEIVAAAMQDYRRAVVVGGKHTHGKGTVQTIIDLNENVPLLHLRRYEDLGALKATIQKFYRIDGGSTQYRGVEPDIVLPSLFQHLKSGEQYLDYSLPWDQDDPADYEAYWDKLPQLDRIIARSLERSEVSEGLNLIREEAKRASERSDQTVIPIDLASIRATRAEEEAARERVGAHYNVLENDGDADQEVLEDSAGDESSDESDWLEDLLKDPYVIEAENIINDLVTFSKEQ
ncbi:MAG: tail-specific protease [Desulfobulbaceae bacterium]|nr:MAG: tail-specific protease [Desulfobulbaceae bacterium]